MLVLGLYFEVEVFWPGCANECLRSHASGDGDVDIEILMFGAQKILLHRYRGMTQLLGYILFRPLQNCSTLSCDNKLDLSCDCGTRLWR